MPLSDKDQKSIKIFSNQISSEGAHNIVSVPVPKTYTVDQFVPGKLNDSKGIKYSNVQKGFKTNEVKNSRFEVHSLTKGPLSILAEDEERILNEVEKRLEVELAVIKERIEKEAFESGIREGRKEAHEMVLNEAKPMVASFEKMISEFDSMRSEIFKANESMLMKMVSQIAKMVILKEVQVDKEYTSRLITQLIDRMGTRENIKIFVSAEVYSAAEVIKTDLAQNLGQLKNISIELDPDVKDSGCRLETEFGEVDARLSVQLENVIKAFDNQSS